MKKEEVTQLNQKRKREDSKEIDEHNTKVFKTNKKCIFFVYSDCEKSKEWLKDNLEKLSPLKIVIGKCNEEKTLYAFCEWESEIDITNDTQFDFEGIHPKISQEKIIGSKYSKNDKYDMLEYIVTKDKDYLEFGISVKEYLQYSSFIHFFFQLKRDKYLLHNGENLPSFLTITDPNERREQFNFWVKYSDNKGFEINRDCYWIVKRAGIGVTTSIMKKYPNIFIKSKDKWWDGYGGENEVLIPNLNSSKKVGRDLKTWAEPYISHLEVRRSFTIPVHTVLIVTSNRTIDEVYKDNQHLNSGIKSRFIEINAEENLGNDGYFDFNIALKKIFM